MASKSQQIQDAAKRFSDAQHVAKVVGGRAARTEMEAARTALSQAAGVRR